jgi:hypothetical protein
MAVGRPGVGYAPPVASSAPDRLDWIRVAELDGHRSASPSLSHTVRPRLLTDDGKVASPAGMLGPRWRIWRTQPGDMRGPSLSLPDLPLAQPMCYFMPSASLAIGAAPSVRQIPHRRRQFQRCRLDPSRVARVPLCEDPLASGVCVLPNAVCLRPQAG